MKNKEDIDFDKWSRMIKEFMNVGMPEHFAIINAGQILGLSKEELRPSLIEYYQSLGFTSEKVETKTKEALKTGMHFAKKTKLL